MASTESDTKRRLQLCPSTFARSVTYEQLMRISESPTAEHTCCTGKETNHFQGLVAVTRTQTHLRRLKSPVRAAATENQGQEGKKQQHSEPDCMFLRLSRRETTGAFN